MDLEGWASNLSLEGLGWGIQVPLYPPGSASVPPPGSGGAGELVAMTEPSLHPPGPHPPPSSLAARGPILPPKLTLASGESSRDHELLEGWPGIPGLWAQGQRWGLEALGSPEDPLDAAAAVGGQQLPPPGVDELLGMGQEPLAGREEASAEPQQLPAPLLAVPGRRHLSAGKGSSGGPGQAGTSGSRDGYENYLRSRGPEGKGTSQAAPCQLCLAA